MATNIYDLGDGFVLRATFTVLGVNTDPTTVVFSLKKPDGTITDYTYGVDAEVVKDAVGLYHMVVTVSEDGNWWYRVVGTGACVAALENTFVGRSSQFI
jgi:hypothetical protein